MNSTDLVGTPPQTGKIHDVRAFTDGARWADSLSTLMLATFEVSHYYELNSFLEAEHPRRWTSGKLFHCPRKLQLYNETGFMNDAGE
jgi:hypothetical protein